MATPATYRTPLTREAVRDYVLHETGAQSRSSSTLLLNVSHSNLKQTRFLELRVPGDMTVGALKDRLYLHTGTRPGSMTLLLRSSERGPVRAELSDEGATLAAAGAAPGDWVHVLDADPASASAGGWLEDVSLVPKYEVSEEKYAARENTYRRYRQKMREQDPGWTMTGAMDKARRIRECPDAEADYALEAPAVAVGDRVEVKPGGNRGEVAFVGRALERLPQGWWVGVRFDEPVGKNDGEVKGVRYFEAPAGYGALVRPSKVTVGDWPVRDIESEDEI